jgi:hypothetical protein
MLSADEILSVLSVPFDFTRKPVPVPGDLRASWKSLLLLAMLDCCCRGNRSSLKRLHVLNWVTRAQHNLQALLGALRGSIEPTTVLVRFDPSLNRAIDRARGFGFIESPRGDRILLSAAGLHLAEQISKAQILAPERHILSQIGYQLTEAKADEILRWHAL